MSKIFTACGDGKIPFISADDIAAVAFHALTDETSHNCDHRVLGPELLTYDDVRPKGFFSLAALLIMCVGRYKALSDPWSQDRTRQAGQGSAHPELGASRSIRLLCEIPHQCRGESFGESGGISGRCCGEGHWSSSEEYRYVHESQCGSVEIGKLSDMTFIPLDWVRQFEIQLDLRG